MHNYGSLLSNLPVRTPKAADGPEESDAGRFSTGHRLEPVGRRRHQVGLASTDEPPGNAADGWASCDGPARRSGYRAESTPRDGPAGVGACADEIQAIDEHRLASSQMSFGPAIAVLRAEPNRRTHCQAGFDGLPVGVGPIRTAAPIAAAQCGFGTPGIIIRTASWVRATVVPMCGRGTLTCVSARLTAWSIVHDSRCRQSCTA
jgi:hypothetical protein